MRMLAILLIIVAVIYILFLRPKATPTAAENGQPVQSAQPATGSPDHSNFLKRPLDRTHEALEANRKRTSDEP